MTARPGCRRRACLAAACGLWVPTVSRAQPAPGWPVRPIRIIVAYPPGGVSDLVARALGEHLARRLAVPVPVENLPGAGGMVALESLSRAPADAQVLAFAAATAVGLLARRRRRDGDGLPVLPVAGVMRTPVLVAGTPALTASRFADMLQHARTHPGSIRWATTGEGTTGHAVLDRVRRASGATIVHVPYKGGGQQVNDAVGGHFEVLSTNVAPQQLDLIRTGRLSALAVGAPARLAALPDTPTLDELGFPQANLDSLFGLFAPPGTAAARVGRLHAEVTRALQDPALRGRLLAADNLPFAGSTEAFAAQVQREIAR